jgi:hypothetical protein
MRTWRTPTLPDAALAEVPPLDEAAAPAVANDVGQTAPDPTP